MSVRAVRLRAGAAAQPEWVEIGANATGRELSSVLASSQPECIELSPRVLLWFDGTPFCATANRLGQFMRGGAFTGTGDVLLVGSRDPRDQCSENDDDDDDSVPCNSDLTIEALAPLFTANFLEKLE